jgi:two-component system, OmpR family, sensor histidine kinase ChvG
MTAMPKIDVRDLNSVRRAAAQVSGTRRADGEVVLGDDWIAPDSAAERQLTESRRKRGLLTLNRSPLARKIITFNLVALILLVAGTLYLTPSRDNLAFQRASGLVSEAELAANVFEAQLPTGAPVNLATGDGIDVAATLNVLNLRGGVEVFVFDPTQALIGRAQAPAEMTPVAGLNRDLGGTLITDLLNSAWEGLASLLAPTRDSAPTFDAASLAQGLVQGALNNGTAVADQTDADGRTIFAVAAPIMHNGTAVGVVAMTSAAGEIDRLVRREREQVLQMFVIGVLVSIGLSLVLASTIANPIADLAAAAELGRDRNARKMSPNRIRIPDLTGRPDEIGRLSGALRGMVAALYERIEGNEQFAADVAHEIKNPLASLRSAVGTLGMVKRDDQRAKMIEVIEHDVRRLDRLVSDIANASRLDSELVKEEEQPIDLLKMLGNLNEFLGKEAALKGIDFIADLPDQAIVIMGLEGRLAQVFVNIVTNAISFCEDGDAIRIWVRKRENRVLVVVEDTGPGIPEEALTKIFQRFYSERPAGDFGNNSGLGLAISKQIVEAHGGVIWAENIRPSEADPTSEPLGARFVVGLPV